MDHFYFGPPDMPLLGLYHPPAAAADRGCGVVVCHPMGQEYMRSHRALRLLALRLAGAGFHVLRFDQSGCGDSGGEARDWSLDRWQRDIAAALVELREGSGASRIFLAGLRLGASLCFLTAAGRDDIEGLVLWDPIVDGSRYLAEAKTAHLRWLGGSFARARGGRSGAPPVEVLGYPFNERLVAELEALRLTAVDPGPVRRTLLLETAAVPGLADFWQHLRRPGGETRHSHLPATPVWVKEGDDFDGALVSNEVLNSAIGWLVEAAA